MTFKKNSGPSSNGRGNKIQNSACLAVCSSLWLERNRRIFEDKQARRHQVFGDNIKYWVALRVVDVNDF